MSGLASQLIVPIALWGNEPPTHCISCIYITPDHRVLATGCNDGHIVLWDVSDETVETGSWRPFSLTPRCMLFGHTAPILCLTSAKDPGSESLPLLVSSSEAG